MTGLAERCAVVLVRPENPENIGLAARAMKNTGFGELRLTGIKRLSDMAYKTAVHAADVLDRAKFYPDLPEAVADLGLVFAATAKPRKNRPLLPLEEALFRARSLPSPSRLGFVFGNERTGLTTEELLRANFVYTIPQAARQPSYNLAAAVLLTLFPLFAVSAGPVAAAGGERPLTRSDQEATIGIILTQLEARGFVHATNRTHIGGRLHDLFGRAALTAADRRLVLALFTKGVEDAPESSGRRPANSRSRR
jgi:tRNA/rRNA methyltransferase